MAAPAAGAAARQCFEDGDTSLSVRAAAGTLGLLSCLGKS